MTRRKQEIIKEILIDYIAGLDNSIENLGDELGRKLTTKDSVILGEFVREWELAPCDEEGPSHEQDEKLDSILEDYAYQLLS